MKKLLRNRVLMAGAVASVTCLLGVSAWADSASTIFGASSGDLVTYDNASGSYPVVTAILSQPGTFNGRNYSSWSFMAEDSTGSLVVYGSTMPDGYTPTVGDMISLSGTYSPYHQIPEIGTLSAISVISSGNPVPAPTVSTIPDLNQDTLPFSVAGHLIELDNVTISGLTETTFGTANLTGTITDEDGNSMTFYHWPTSYSAANANLFGQAIPTGPVTLIGFDSVYTSSSTGISTPEFTPIMIVPEPSCIALGALGLLAWSLIRRRQ